MSSCCVRDVEIRESPEFAIAVVDRKAGAIAASGPGGESLLWANLFVIFLLDLKLL